MKTEAKIQQEIVIWYRNNFCLKHHQPQRLIFSVPNESKSKQETFQKMSIGMMPGVADLIVVEENKTTFFEIKTPTGRQSKNQINFQKMVEKLNHNYFVVRSLDEFKKIIQDEKKSRNSTI